MAKAPKDSREIFTHYLPPAAVEYCFRVWQEYSFRFIITKSRKTKLGDYRYYPSTKQHTITVNGDLNPYAFLVTYLHEAAHMSVQIAHGNKVQPHGFEWKEHFKDMLAPMLFAEVFPPDVQKALSDYALNPKASSCSDLDLYKALRNHDVNNDGQVFLSEILPGQYFSLNQRIFSKGEVRRTRVMCECVRTGRKYLVAKEALVNKVDA